MDIESLIVEDPARKTFRVHRSVMTSPEIFELERKQIFSRSWLLIGHESEIEQPGDFRRREVGGRPLIFMRGKDGVVRVFHNSCTHWGTKLCRLDQGNAATFQCFYHAWTFNNLGELIAIPDAGGYPENFDRAEMALKSPPHVDNYRGLYFVNFDPGAQPLLDYLAGAKDYMDLILDQSEAGWRVVAGTQMYTVRANWKLMATNSLDTYHAAPLHTTYFSYMAKFKGLDYEAETNASSIRPGGHGRSLGNGHGVGESAPGGLARPIAHWHPMFGEAARAEIERVRKRIFERFAPERAGKMCDTFRLFLIYPNFVFHDIMAVTLRYFEPVAPDAVRLTVYALAPKNESKQQLELRLNNFVSFLGPGGFAHPDDLEAIESCQDGFRSQEVEWSDFSKGMNRDPEVLDELPMRAFWRQWQAQMLGHDRATRFDDLRLAANGVSAAGK